MLRVGGAMPGREGGGGAVNCETRLSVPPAFRHGKYTCVLYPRPAAAATCRPQPFPAKCRPNAGQCYPLTAARSGLRPPGRPPSRRRRLSWQVRRRHRSSKRPCETDASGKKSAWGRERVGGSGRVAGVGGVRRDRADSPPWCAERASLAGPWCICDGERRRWPLAHPPAVAIRAQAE
jgi:hypothetical protein